MSTVSQLLKQELTPHKVSICLLIRFYYQFRRRSIANAFLPSHEQRSNDYQTETLGRIILELNECVSDIAFEPTSTQFKDIVTTRLNGDFRGMILDVWSNTLLGLTSPDQLYDVLIELDEMLFVDNTSQPLQMVEYEFGYNKNSSIGVLLREYMVLFKSQSFYALMQLYDQMVVYVQGLFPPHYADTNTNTSHRNVSLLQTNSSFLYSRNESLSMSMSVCEGDSLNAGHTRVNTETYTHTQPSTHANKIALSPGDLHKFLLRQISLVSSGVVQHSGGNMGVGIDHKGQILDLPEQHYYSSLIHSTHNNVTQTLSDLHQYFDATLYSHTQLPSEVALYTSQQFTIVCLALFHYQRNNIDVALVTLEESLKLAQSRNDVVCLYYCCYLLYKICISTNKQSLAKQLLATSLSQYRVTVAKAKEVSRLIQVYKLSQASREDKAELEKNIIKIGLPDVAVCDVFGILLIEKSKADLDQIDSCLESVQSQSQPQFQFQDPNTQHIRSALDSLTECLAVAYKSAYSSNRMLHVSQLPGSMFKADKDPAVKRKKETLVDVNRTFSNADNLHPAMVYAEKAGIWERLGHAYMADMYYKLSLHAMDQDMKGLNDSHSNNNMYAFHVSVDLQSHVTGKLEQLYQTYRETNLLHTNPTHTLLSGRNNLHDTALDRFHMAATLPTSACEAKAHELANTTCLQSGGGEEETVYLISPKSKVIESTLLLLAKCSQLSNSFVDINAAVKRLCDYFYTHINDYDVPFVSELYRMHVLTALKSHDHARALHMCSQALTYLDRVNSVTFSATFMTLFIDIACDMVHSPLKHSAPLGFASCMNNNAGIDMHSVSNHVLTVYPCLLKAIQTTHSAGMNSLFCPVLLRFGGVLYSLQCYAEAYACTQLAFSYFLNNSDYSYVVRCLSMAVELVDLGKQSIEDSSLPLSLSLFMAFRNQSSIVSPKTSLSEIITEGDLAILHKTAIDGVDNNLCDLLYLSSLCELHGSLDVLHVNNNFNVMIKDNNQHIALSQFVPYSKIDTANAIYRNIYKNTLDKLFLLLVIAEHTVNQVYIKQALYLISRVLNELDTKPLRNVCAAMFNKV